MTKLELEQRLAAATHELEASRMAISILRADVARLTRQLQLNVAEIKAPSTPQQVRMCGQLCNIVLERVGQRTIKRFVPV